RSGLLSLHARVAAAQPTAWEDPSLIQLWSPRTAVHLVAAADRAVYTLGRLPRDAAARRQVEAAADAVRRALGGRRRRKTEVFPAVGGAVFAATVTGTIVIRWDARDTLLWEEPAPEADPEELR